MSEELKETEPEIELLIRLSNQNGQPRLILNAKTITSIEKIRLISQIALKENYIPAKIIIKDKLIFFANLKKSKII